MNKRIIILREAIGVVTRMLSRKGIKVTHAGLQAYVRYDEKTLKPLQVNLPHLPDNSTEELIAAVQGFLDHEVGHLLFTDPTATRQSYQEKIQSIAGILEDPFIERKMAGQFRGSGSNLATVARFVLDRLIDPPVQEQIQAGTDPATLFKSLMVPVVRAWAGQSVWADYMKDKWVLIESVTRRIDPAIIAAIPQAQSTWDNLELARKINQALSEPPSQKPEQPQDSQPPQQNEPNPSPEERNDDPQQNNSQSQSTDPDREDDDQPGDDQKGDQGDQPGDESDDTEGNDAPGDEPDSSDDSVDQDDDSGLNDDIDTHQENDHGFDESSPSDADEGPGDEDQDANDNRPTDGGVPEREDQTGNPVEQDDEPIDLSDVKEFEDYLEDHINAETIDAARGADYLVYTTEHDKFGPPSVDELKTVRDHEVACLKTDTDRLVGNLQKSMERLVAARSRSFMVPGYRSGRLHGGSLHRLKSGNHRVFRRKEEHTSKDSAVMLVVDFSGSMCGAGKINVAMQAAYGLCATLERLKVKNEVIGFTTASASGELLKEIHASEEATGLTYSRYEPLNLPLLKSFDEQLRPEIIRRFAWGIGHVDMNNNIDGEALQFCYRRLMSRPEENKIMLVLSDGNPVSFCGRGLRDHLAHTVNEIERSGVKVMGFGIRSTAVQHFYKRWTVLDNIEELPGKLMKELQGMLLAA